MGDNDPITVAQCAIVHATVGQSLAAIEKKLDVLNGSVAENTRFRVQSKAAYGVIIFAWVSIVIPLTAIAVAVLA